MLSKQELFDRAVKATLIQNARSGDENESLYVDGPRRCPIGHVLGARYLPEMEGVPATDRVILDALGVPESYRTLVKGLQDVHDRSEVGDWANRFYGLAKKLKLKTDVVNKHRPR